MEHYHDFEYTKYGVLMEDDTCESLWVCCGCGEFARRYQTKFWKFDGVNKYEYWIINKNTPIYEMIKDKQIKHSCEFTYKLKPIFRKEAIEKLRKQEKK